RVRCAGVRAGARSTRAAPRAARPGPAPSRPGGFGGPSRSAAHDEMGPAVLLPRTVIVAGRERPLLAVRDDLEAAAVDPGRDQVVPRRLRAPLPERLVVLRRAALVAVSLDDDRDGRMVAQQFRVLVERRPRVV